MERIAFVQSVIQALERDGWLYKTDAGWSDFDVEIFASRWGHLYLTTVVEPHGYQKILLRCRMRTTWSLLAKLSFWGMAGLELLIIGVFRSNFPWLWLLLLTLPLFAWFIDSDRRNLQRIIVLLLDEIAGRYGSVKMRKAGH